MADLERSPRVWRTWLDGPVALASVLPAIGEMTVATTIALPVVRGPAPLAKALAAIDRLSGGRLVVGGRMRGQAARYEAAGAERVLIWPVGDELHQLERFHDTVMDRLDAG